MWRRLCCCWAASAWVSELVFVFFFAWVSFSFTTLCIRNKESSRNTTFFAMLLFVPMKYMVTYNWFVISCCGCRALLRLLSVFFLIVAVNGCFWVLQLLLLLLLLPHDWWMHVNADKRCHASLVHLLNPFNLILGFYFFFIFCLHFVFYLICFIRLLIYFHLFLLTIDCYI